MGKHKRVREPLVRDTRERPLDHIYTDATPGCGDKLEFMRGRVERGVSLFHPRDKGISENYRQIENYDWNRADEE